LSLVGTLLDSTIGAGVNCGTSFSVSKSEKKRFIIKSKEIGLKNLLDYTDNFFGWWQSS